MEQVCRKSSIKLLLFDSITIIQDTIWLLILVRCALIATCIIEATKQSCIVCIVALIISSIHLCLLVMETEWNNSKQFIWIIRITIRWLPTSQLKIEFALPDALIGWLFVDTDTWTPWDPRIQYRSKKRNNNFDPPSNQNALYLLHWFYSDIEIIIVFRECRLLVLVCKIILLFEILKSNFIFFSRSYNLLCEFQIEWKSLID